LPIWDNIGRELRNLWEILTGGEPIPDDIPEETEDEPGGFFGGEEPPEEPPGSAGFGSDDEDRGYFGYNAGDGPYPYDWGDAEIRFWDRVAGEHMFFGQENYDEAQRQFELGFIEDDIDTEDRNAAREEFLEQMLWTVMDWDAFEDYYSET
jgi:hypothetical protein